MTDLHERAKRLVDMILGPRSSSCEGSYYEYVDAITAALEQVQKEAEAVYLKNAAAIKAEVREECAKVAESEQIDCGILARAKKLYGTILSDHAYNLACRDIAQAIRTRTEES